MLRSCSQSSKLLQINKIKYTRCVKKIGFFWQIVFFNLWKLVFFISMTTIY